MRRRTRTLAIAVPACAVALALVPTAAQANRGLVPVPAPPAQASAVAAQVGSLVDVSRTEAAAGSDTASSDASVVRIGEQSLLGMGGRQSGDGQTGGALLDTGAALPARVQAAPWAAEAQGSNSSTRRGRSAAAVARADLPDVAQAGVLTSQSEATHTDQRSNGTAVSDGLQLSALDILDLVLLHSEVRSEGGGSSYLVGLNGTEIGTDEQLGASPLCALDAASLLSLSCLSASGGSGSVGGVGSAGAQVAQITPALEALAVLNPVAAFTASATSGTGETAAAPVPEPIAPLASEAARATTPAAVEAASSGAGAGFNTLARTGATVASMAAVALALLLAGFGLRRFRMRPATN